MNDAVGVGENDCSRLVARNRRHGAALIELARRWLNSVEPSKGIKLLSEAAALRQSDAVVALEAGTLALGLGDAALASSMRSIAESKGATPEQLAALPRDDSEGFGRADRTLRILVVTNIYPPQELGGYGRYMCDFANALRLRGHSIQVYTSDSRYLGEIPSPEPGIDRSARLLGSWSGGGARWIEDAVERNNIVVQSEQNCARLIEQFRPDVALVGNLDMMSLGPLRALAGAGIPMVAHIGNIHACFSMSDLLPGARVSLAASSHWLQQRLVADGFAPNQVSVIYPAAWARRFHMSVPPDLSLPRLAFASLVMPYKGPHIMVQALHRLHLDGRDFRCTIAGDSIDSDFVRQLGAFLRDNRLEAKVQLAGLLKRDALLDMYATHNLLLFPSQFEEPFGISQVEAMAAGCLVVTSGTGGSCEAVDGGRAGIVYRRQGMSDAEQVEALAGELRSLFDDRARWAALAAAGQKRAIAEFDIGVTLRRLELQLLAAAEGQMDISFLADTDKPSN